jgi:hypothetical protein
VVEMALGKALVRGTAMAIVKVLEMAIEKAAQMAVQKAIDRIAPTEEVLLVTGMQSRVARAIEIQTVIPGLSREARAAN